LRALLTFSAEGQHNSEPLICQPFFLGSVYFFSVASGTLFHGEPIGDEGRLYLIRVGSVKDFLSKNNFLSTRRKLPSWCLLSQPFLIGVFRQRGEVIPDTTRDCQGVFEKNMRADREPLFGVREQGLKFGSKVAWM